MAETVKIGSVEIPVRRGLTEQQVREYARRVLDTLQPDGLADNIYMEGAKLPWWVSLPDLQEDLKQKIWQEELQSVRLRKNVPS